MGSTLEATALVVEESQVAVHEADQPDFFIDFLAADVLISDPTQRVSWVRSVRRGGAQLPADPKAPGKAFVP